MSSPCSVGRGCSCACAVRSHSSAPLKGANAERLKCCLLAAARCGFRARRNKAEIYLHLYLYHKMRTWKSKSWGTISFQRDHRSTDDMAQKSHKYIVIKPSCVTIRCKMISKVSHNASRFYNNMTTSPPVGVYEQSFDRMIRKVPARAWAFHVMPRQRVYSNNLGQISANA